MPRRIIRAKGAKSATVSATAPVQSALPFSPQDLATAIAAAVAQLGIASAPPALPSEPKAIKAVKAAPKAAVKAPKRDWTPIPDTSIRRQWLPLDESVVRREFTRLTTVRYDSKAGRFRAPTTIERRAKSLPSHLVSASGVLPAGATYTRLSQLGFGAPGADGLLLRNAHAGVELRFTEAAGKLAIAARTLDNSPFASASRGAKLAVTNLLNALLPA